MKAKLLSHVTIQERTLFRHVNLPPSVLRVYHMADFAMLVDSLHHTPPGHSFTDDYYANDYTPVSVLHRWSELRSSMPCGTQYESRGRSHVCHDAGRQLPGRDATWLHNETRSLYGDNADMHPSTPNGAQNCLTSSPSHFGQRYRSIPHGAAGEAKLTELFDRSSSSTSTGSTYARHHRYDATDTAWQELSDPYDRAVEVERQERFMQESRRLGQPFLPAGVASRTLDQPTRMLLGDCVRDLYRCLARDWVEAMPMIVTTAEDLVAVFFSPARLSGRRAGVLLRYMNAALVHNTIIRHFMLSKVPEAWNVLTDSGEILYVLRPPWVQRRPFLPHTVHTLLDTA